MVHVVDCVVVVAGSCSAWRVIRRSIVKYDDTWLVETGRLVSRSNIVRPIPSTLEQSCSDMGVNYLCVCVGYLVIAPVFKNRLG